MSKKLNILLVAPQPFMQDRGTPIAVRMLAQTLSGIGHTVHLLVFHEGRDINMAGVTLHRSKNLKRVANVRPGFSWKKLVCDFFLLLKMFQLRKRIEFDIIHAVEESVFFARVFKTLFKIQYVYDMDSLLSEQLLGKHPALSPLKGLFEHVEKGAVRESIGVLTVCSALESITRKWIPTANVATIEDISMIKSTADCGEDLRERYGIKGICLLYVGNLEKYQGIDLLLQAFSRALESNAAIDLVIIGGIASDRKAYTQMISDIGIQDKVHIVGPRKIEDLSYYLDQADILVSPRIQGNNTPMKIYSYLDSGKPTIATNIATHTQLLHEGIAFLAEPEADDFARAIVKLSEDPMLRKKLGETAKAFVQSEYSAQAYERKVKDFYANIAKRLEG